jgi:hypothetical protein
MQGLRLDSAGAMRLQKVESRTFQANGTQHAPRNGNLLMLVRVCRKVKHHRVLVERRMYAKLIPPATVLGWVR